MDMIELEPNELLVVGDQFRTYPEYRLYIDDCSGMPSFNGILMEANPGIVSIRYCNDILGNFDRIIKFESEEHKNWFILSH